MMRTLKDQMSRDRFTFLNPKEFGEEMLVDGEACLGSWDKEEEQPVKQFFGQGWDNAIGVFTVERVLYLMRTDGAIMETPVPQQELDIDGKIWTVRDAEPESGIVKLTLYRNES
jgi:hypothetical protein